MTNPNAHAAGTDLAKPRETTPEERSVLSAHFARRKQKRPTPRVNLFEKAGSIEVSTDHPVPPLGNALIMESLATADVDFFDGLLGQLLNVGMQGKTPDERGMNFMLTMIRGIGPDTLPSRYPRPARHQHDRSGSEAVREASVYRSKRHDAPSSEPAGRCQGGGSDSQASDITCDTSPARGICACADAWADRSGI
jgi:hypothetical protein